MKAHLRTLFVFAVAATSSSAFAQALMPKLTPRYAERVLSEYLEEIAVESLGNILSKCSSTSRSKTPKN